MGQLGCKGHVCCFQKDLSENCYFLPRLPDDISVIRVVRKFHDSEKQVTSKAFSVRKSKILDALKWLCKYNKFYKNVHIEEQNLNWMKGMEEYELPGKIINETIPESHPNSVDAGPAPLQTTQVTDAE